MNTTYVDTSYLLALVLNDDSHHVNAKSWSRAVHGKLLTTEFILVEFMDAMAGRKDLRDLGFRTIAAIKRNSTIEVSPAISRLFQDGLDLFVNRPDKAWSLTDCISFAVMQRAGITDALTSDRHFEQAGFRALLRHTPA